MEWSEVSQWWRCVHSKIIPVYEYPSLIHCGVVYTGLCIRTAYSVDNKMYGICTHCAVKVYAFLRAKLAEIHKTAWNVNTHGIADLYHGNTTIDHNDIYLHNK